MFRFISWLAVGIAAAFLVVATASFSAATAMWLAFAIGIGTLVVSTGVAIRHRKDVASVLVGLVTAVVSVWAIVSSLVFSQSTVESLALASALAIGGLAVAGLTANEVEHDYSLSSRRREDTVPEGESRLAAAA
jgi:FtsH-binding integral membrane protein